jgi:hypothetical protein
MFERIERRGESHLGEPGRHHAGMRGASGMERFSHRAEVSCQPGALRSAE